MVSFQPIAWTGVGRLFAPTHSWPENDTIVEAGDTAYTGGGNYRYERHPYQLLSVRLTL